MNGKGDFSYLGWCVSCGKRIERNPESGLPDHKCDVRHEAGKEGANRAAEEPRKRRRSLRQRLQDGFDLLEEGEV